MNNKTKIIVSFSVLLIAVIILYCMVLFDVEPLNIKESSYVGVLVTIMGILVTIIVGYQIYNSIDIKEHIKKVEEYKRFQDEMSDSLHRSNATVLSNRAILAKRDEAFDSSVALFLAAIKELFMVKDLNCAIGDINREMENLLRVFDYDFKIEKSDQINKINSTINDIISSHYYNSFSDQLQNVFYKLNKINSDIIVQTKPQIKDKTQ